MIYISHSDVLEGQVVAVDVEGTLDSTTSPDFQEYMENVLSHHRFIMLNTANIQSVSSAGIGVLLLLQKQISALRGSIVLYGMKDELSTLFTLLGFDRLFQIATSRIDAMQTIDRKLELADESGPLETPEENDDSDDEIETVEETERSIERTGSMEDSSPMVIECIHCGTLVRISMSGDYKCPECETEFSVRTDGTVVF